MGFWTWIDDSILTAELIVGAIVAALAAALLELAQHQAMSHLKVRFEWLIPVLRLPRKVLAETVTIFVALARRLLRGEDPPSSFRTVPVDETADDADGATRRALIVAMASFAPNSFALGIDRERSVMVVHELVGTRRNRGSHRSRGTAQRRSSDD